MSRHAMRPFRVTIHTTKDAAAPSTILMATCPRDAILEALGSLRQETAERLDHIEVSDCTVH